MAFITGKTDPGGAAGWAPVGVICNSHASSRRLIGAKVGRVTMTAYIVAHEAGHNLGMSHDFVSKNNPRYYKGQSCDNKGIMSYGSPPMEWSKCSKNDFMARYNLVGSANWCLESKFYLLMYFIEFKHFQCKYQHSRKGQHQVLWSL